MTTEPTLRAFSEIVSNKQNYNYDIFPNGDTNELDDITVIAAVGDISCSSQLQARIKIDNPTLFVALGDLCYDQDLSNFKTKFTDLKVANKFACVIGNHEALEDGNAKILKQTSEFCGDHWNRKIANNSTLLIGLNTNGDITLQSDWGQSLVTNTSFMNGIKNVMLMSHKPAHTPPGSSHEAVYSTINLFSSITNKIPGNIRVFEITAHNHLMAESSNGQWFVSGGGGRKLHSVSANPDWSFINNNNHGYLQIKINNTDGKVFSTDFYGLNGFPLFSEYPPVVKVSEEKSTSTGRIINLGSEK